MHKLSVTIGERTFVIELETFGNPDREYKARVDGQELLIRLPHPEHPFEQIDWLVIDDRPYEIVFDPNLRWIRAGKGRYPVHVRDLEAGGLQPISRDGRVKAPIPGLISRVLVKPGDQVEVGQSLVILEAMKMENEIRAPRPGLVKEVNVVPGQDVALQQVLVEIE